MTDLEALKNRRQGVKSWMTRGKNLLEVLGKEIPLPRNKIVAQLESLEIRLVELRRLQSDIECKIDSLTDSSALEAEVSAQADFDDGCVETIFRFKDLVRISTTSSPVQKGHSSGTSSDAAAKSSYKLPRVDIPKFSGKLTDWIPFIQSFTNAVDKLNIPDYLKLTILRKHVEGEPEKIIIWYALTDENYAPALKSLNDKYGNNLKLIDAYVDQQVQLILTGKSLSLRDIYNRLHSSVKILETLEVTRENYAVILVPMMRNCLPLETRKEWAKYELLNNPAIVKNPDPSEKQLLPNRLTLFLAFLHQEVEIKELTDNMTQGSLSKPGSGNKEKSDKKDSTSNGTPSKDKPAFQQNGSSTTGEQSFPSTGAFMATHPGHLQSLQQQPRHPSIQGSRQKKKSGPGDRQMMFGYSQFQAPGRNNPFPSSKVLCPPCPFCFLHHHPASCSRADSHSPGEILALVQRDLRCELCLGYHPHELCRTQRSCIVCGGPHHPLLCSRRSFTPSKRAEFLGVRPALTGPQTSFQPRLNVPTFSSQFQPGLQSSFSTLNMPAFPPPTTQGVRPGAPGPMGTGQIFAGITGAHVNSTYQSSCGSSSVLQTATVTAVNQGQGQSGRSLTVRLLLDPGSQRSYVTTDTVQTLEIEPHRHEVIATSAFGGYTSTPTQTPIANLRLNSRYHDLGGVSIDAFVVPTITNCLLPVVSHTILEPGNPFSSLPLADSGEFCRLPISVLVGMDYYWDIVGSDIKRLTSENCTIVGMNSVFGYILSGRDCLSPPQTVSCHMTVIKQLKPDLDPLLEQFWKLESLGISDDDLVRDDDLAMRIFKDNIFFDGTRYVVGLTWKPGHPPLQSNFRSARARFLKLSSNLSSDPTLEAAYAASIQEFVEEGYVERAPTTTTADAHAVFYLPHRPVVKPGSSTYKVRPVMDASAKDPSGLALNDCLMIGPPLLPDLFVTLMSFRLEPVAFIGDIRRAFLRIGIKVSDRDALRFITKDGIMRFTRVPFGTSCSPFLLNATIRHHLQIRQAMTDLESQVEKDLDEKLYVDDYASGSPTDSQATEKIRTAISILSEADMELRSWSSNSSAVMETLKNQGIHTEPDTSPSVLGVKWNTMTDELSIRPVEWKSDSISKRAILSFIAQIYDVLGLYSPITIRGKILLQTLFRMGVSWDEVITDPDVISEFRVIQPELVNLSSVTLPRCVAPDPEQDYTIHLLCDASPKSYACAIYVASPESSYLLAAKARVAPIKSPKTVATVPRLELLACYLGSKLLSKFLALPWARSVVAHCWTDSLIALSWINYPERIKTRDVFVSNRVRKIRELTPDSEWHYVPTDLNTGDLATRPTQTIQSLQDSRWFSGPEFILKPPDDWPQSNQSDSSDDFTGFTATSDTGTVRGDVCSIFDLNDKSRLERALKITAYVFRFITNCDVSASKTRQPPARRVDNLATLPVGNCEIETESGVIVSAPSEAETQRALDYWIICSQTEHYRDELSSLASKSQISLSSEILDLKPYLDKDGIMRSLGRCHRATGYPSPIILPAKDRLTSLIIAQTHEKLCHAGVTTTLTELRLNYWIVKGRRTVKILLNNCLVCRRFRAKPYLQIESALPEFRLTPEQPFLLSGCDFAGPLYIKEGTAYILLFTCCNVRAIHLEVTPDKSATSVLQAFSRFVDRRGACKFLISDNDKAFLKARQSLPEVKWVTIPERSPWWGGFYERMVKSFKNPIKRCLGKSTLYYEELRTLAPHIEAAVNRRPITHVSDDAGDPMPLRPVDFLLCPGPPELTGPSLSFPASWRHRLATYQTLYSRWKKEYLAELHRWSKARSNGHLVPKVGDVVMVDPLNVSNRALFPLGRITSLIVGRDEHCRAVYVKLANGKILRRTTKLLYPLETDGVEPPPVRKNSSNSATAEPVLYRTRSGRVVKTRKLDS